MGTATEKKQGERKPLIEPLGPKSRTKRGAALSQRATVSRGQAIGVKSSSSKIKKTPSQRVKANQLDGTAAGAIQIALPPTPPPAAVAKHNGEGEALVSGAQAPQGLGEGETHSALLSPSQHATAPTAPSGCGVGASPQRAGATVAEAAPAVTHDPRDGGLWGAESTSSLSGQISALLGASAFASPGFNTPTDGFFNGPETTGGATPEPEGPAVSAAGNPLFTSTGQKIKALPPSVVKDIEQKNIARRLAGLSVITIKVRRCIACGSPFESAGNRTCGCSNRAAGSIAGREII